jgi:hypothetical protein
MITQVSAWYFRRVLWAALIAIAAALGTPSTASGQTVTGTVRGYVRDQGGAPLGEAQVSARNVDLGIIRAVTTNAAGFYNLAGLRAGQYEISARRLGHSPRNQIVQVPIAQTVTADLVLQSGAVQLQAITTVAENVAIRTSEVGMNVSAEQIRDLPVLDRNFLDFAKLVPGITPKNVNDDSKSITAGGQPAEAINIFIDGASYKNDVLKGGVLGQDASKGNPFPQAAVQEFRVITQNYKAEYQKASSAIITATTKTGGNAWEGEVFAFGVTKNSVAKDAFAARQGSARPNYQRLQAGGSIGGPIRKDKLFFFGTYELNSRDEPRDVALGGNAALAPAGLNPQQYVGRFTSEFLEHLAFTKLTWIASDKSTVDGSVTFRRDDDFRDFGGERSYSVAENMKVDNLTGVVNWRRAGGTWLNEAQLNMQRGVWSPQPKNPDVIGQNYIGIIRIGGRDTRQEFTQDRIGLRNDVTRAPLNWAGAHVVKTGVSFDFLAYEGIKHQFGNPLYEYRTNENFAFPFQALIGFGDPKIARNNTQLGGYIQDDWDVTDKLTLNLGLRWDVETNGFNNDYVTPQPLADSLRNNFGARFYVDRPTATGNVQVRTIDQLGGINNFVTSGRSDRPMFLGAFQPRLGASYDLRGDGRTVLFGGFGMYYDRNYWNTLFDEQFRRQFKVLRIDFNTTGPTATCPRCVQWNNNYLDPAQLQTLAASGNSGLPEVFLVKNDLRPPKTHQMSAGVRQQWRRQIITLSYNGVRGYNGMNFIRASQPLAPNYESSFITDDNVRTWYDAMQLQIERPLSSSMSWGGALAYTLSDAKEQGQPWDLFWGFDNRYPTVKDMPRKAARFSQTHTIVANAIGRLPYEFLLSGIVTLGSGIREMGNDNSAGNGPFERRFYVYDPPTRPFLGIGNVFASQNLDVRLQKALRTVSTQNAAVIVDLFNAFNSKNWGCFDRTIAPTSGPPNANYGRAGCASLGRRLQIGMRYGFNGGDDDGR